MDVYIIIENINVYIFVIGWFLLVKICCFFIVIVMFRGRGIIFFINVDDRYEIFVL